VPDGKRRCPVGVSAIDLHVPDLPTLHERRSEKWTGHDNDVLVATIAEMDFPLAEPIADVLRAAIGRSDLGYATPAPRRLRDAFAGFARRRLRWDVDPEQITLVPDVMVGLVELSRVLAGPNGAAAFVTPAYPPFFTALPHAVARLEHLAALENGAVDLDALARSIEGGSRVLILTNPHNPTGRVLPRPELEAIAELCAERDVCVLADEIHAPLVLPGAEHTPWLEVSDAARSCGVALTSASKAFNVAGLKAALLVTASDRMRGVVARLPDLTDQAGLLGVLAAEAAFAEGDEWLDAVLAQLDANRSLLAEHLAAEVPAIRCQPPAAGYLAWLDCRALGLGDEPARIFLERGRVALKPGLNYGREGAGFARLNFGTSPDLVAEAVRRMRSALC
jgi:cysteine-S-conjugate beta-lyase